MEIKLVKGSTSPRPSPPGEGELSADFLKNLWPDLPDCHPKNKNMPMRKVLSWGEDLGEGGQRHPLQF